MNLAERMAQWRDGLLSDTEILTYLFEAQAEVLVAMRKAEDKAAELRMVRLGI